jgi:6-phosphogluconolactonase
MRVLRIARGRRLLPMALACTASVAATAGAALGGGARGAVYTLTNSAAGNAVAVFDRAGDGTLTPAGTVPTGGVGTGAGLGSQNALVLNEDGKLLLAVNAGSNTISAFSVEKRGLMPLGAPVPSGGTQPISLTVEHEIVYVLNAGSPENITGFRIGKTGLTPIPGSTRPLSGAGVGPAEVQFSPNGKLLVVTEKGTNSIDTYVVGHDGLTTGPNSQASAAATPYGFAFGGKGRLIVSDAVGGAPVASGLSSYDVSKSGVLGAVTPFLGDTQTAACWVVVTKNGRFAYTTNTGSASVSSYRIGHDGSLTLQNAVAGATGATPTDVDLSRDGRYLYAHVSGAISGFRVDSDGSLTPVAGATGLPAGSVGIAAS